CLGSSLAHSTLRDLRAYHCAPLTGSSALSLHDALPISPPDDRRPTSAARRLPARRAPENFQNRLRPVLCLQAPWRTRRANSCCRSEEHTSELQSRFEIVCRLLLEKKNNCSAQTDSSDTR